MKAQNLHEENEATQAGTAVLNVSAPQIKWPRSEASQTERSSLAANTCQKNCATKQHLIEAGQPTMTGIRPTVVPAGNFSILMSHFIAESKHAV